jgi:hypothetical protein
MRQEFFLEAYKRLYQNSPRYLKNILSKSVFVLTNKPYVNKTDNLDAKRFPHGYKGALIISADFELGWAWRYSRKKENPLEMARRARKNFPKLIKLFGDYSIPVTWATVGHLMLRSCNKDSHNWMRRIPYFRNEKWIYDKGDWFDADPCTSWDKAKEWYAPDLIEMILDSRVEHEIGCHTFSHIDMSYKNCPSEVAEDEIKACFESAKEWGIILKSFVFCAGTYGNYEVLKKYGFTNYRMKLRYDLSYPLIDQHEFVVMPSSCGLEIKGFGWSKEYFTRRLKKYIDRAVSTGTVCHFWFHPSIDEWFLSNIFPDILRHATELRDKNLLWIQTMAKVAEHAASRLKKI